MEIRNISLEDLPEFLSLMKLFAAFDGSSDEFVADISQLEKVFFGDVPFLSSWVVESENKLIGFLNYSFSFSSFSCKKTLWIEDVFVLESYRYSGIGKALFEKVRDTAKDNDCNNAEWLVRKNNLSGIKFYKGIGAKVYDDTRYVSWSF